MPVSKVEEEARLAEIAGQQILVEIDTGVAAIWAKNPNDPFWIEFALRQRKLLDKENEVYGSVD